MFALKWPNPFIVNQNELVKYRAFVILFQLFFCSAVDKGLGFVELFYEKDQMINLKGEV